MVSKDKFEIQANRNNCFGLSLVMIANLLEGLFTYTNLCQATHAYTSYILHQNNCWKIALRHFIDCHELDYVKFRLMRIFSLDINRLTILSVLAAFAPHSVLPIILLNSL